MMETADRDAAAETHRAEDPTEAGAPGYLVIAAGGTGGHMFPAQSLAEEMLRRGWRVALSSDRRGMRYARAFPQAVKRRRIHAASPSGGLAQKLIAPSLLLYGAADTYFWFRHRRPSVVAGFGGYATLPALTAATALGVPRLIHEPDGVLGQANRLFAGRVAAISCGMDRVAGAPAQAPQVVVGNPLRDAARALVGAPYAPILPGGPIRLLVFGGSQGARVFSENAPAAIGRLPEAVRARLLVTQQARKEDAEAVREAYQAVEVRAEIAPFFDDMPRRIADAHLVVSRAGASTIAELTGLGRPSILAPYPAAAGDHQTANARVLSDRGAAVLAPDAALKAGGLTALLQQLFDDPDRLAAMAKAARGLGKPKASQALADLVARVARGDPL